MKKDQKAKPVGTKGKNAGGSHHKEKNPASFSQRVLKTDVRKIKHSGRKSLDLHFPNITSAIESLKAGLPIEVYIYFSEQSGISQSQLAEAINISHRTLARRKQGKRLSFDESERLYRLSRLFERAVNVLGSLERARQWFKAPSHGLGGKSPLEYSETEVGAREVEDLLGRIEHGIF